MEFRSGLWTLVYRLLLVRYFVYKYDVPIKKTAKFRDRFWEHPQLIDGYLEEYGHNLSQEEVATVNSWEDRISGRYFKTVEKARYLYPFK